MAQLASFNSGIFTPNTQIIKKPVVKPTNVFDYGQQTSIQGKKAIIKPVTNDSNFQKNIVLQARKSPSFNENIYNQKMQEIERVTTQKTPDILQSFLQDMQVPKESKLEVFRSLQDGVKPEELIAHLQNSGYNPKKTQLQKRLDNSIVAKGVGTTVGGLLQGVGQAGVGLSNIVTKATTYGMNIGSQVAGGQGNIKPVQFENPYIGLKREGIFGTKGTGETQNIKDTNIGQDLLSYGAGLTTSAQNIYFPVINTVFNTAGQTETGQKVLSNPASGPVIGAVIGALTKNWRNIVKGGAIGGFPIVVDKTVEELGGSLGEEDKQSIKTIITDGFFSYLGGSGEADKYKQEIKKGVKDLPGTIKRIPNIGESIKAKQSIRPSEDITANILQPYKGLVGSLEKANPGLKRIVLETGVGKDADYEVLKKAIETTKQKYGGILDNQLGNIKGEYKSKSADNALTQLEDIYSGTLSADFQVLSNKIKVLKEKNIKSGLTAKELNEVKILHTNASDLFNTKGQATGGFAKDDLRSIRREIKTDIEKFGEEQGITNIKDINRIYGELLSAEKLLKNQADNVKSFKGRQIPEKPIDKFIGLLVKLPIIKQLGTDPLRTLAFNIFPSLRGDKITPLEVQKRLPEFLNELRKAGIKEGDIKDVQIQLSNKTIKKTLALPQAGQSSYKKPAIITPLGDKNIILQSKKGLEKTKFGNKSGFVNPTAILSDIKKGIEKAGRLNINEVANKLATGFKTNIQVVKNHIKDYIRKNGPVVKEKLADLFDYLADKLGVRSKFIDDIKESNML